MKDILIIGANSNIGSSLARYYLKEGYRLHLIYHHHKNHLADLFDHPQCTFFQADITVLASLKNIPKALKSVPDCLFFCSALRSIDHKPISQLDLDYAVNIINVNLLGFINCLKVFLPIMQDDILRRIVVFGSNVSRIGLPYGSVYASTKAAVANLVRSVAVEEAKNNILINAISPGPIEIDDSHFPEDYRNFRERYYEEKKKNIPLNRLANIQEIIHLCDFLISDSNTYMTGEEIFFTGGSL